MLDIDGNTSSDTDPDAVTTGPGSLPTGSGSFKLDDRSVPTDLRPLGDLPTLG